MYLLSLDFYANVRRTFSPSLTPIDRLEAASAAQKLGCPKTWPFVNMVRSYFQYKCPCHQAHTVATTYSSPLSPRFLNRCRNIILNKNATRLAKPQIISRCHCLWPLRRICAIVFHCTCSWFCIEVFFFYFVAVFGLRIE